MHTDRYNLRTIWLVAALAVPLVLLAGAGLFTRLQQDDYCFMSMAQQDGAVAAVVRLYNTWFGRYTAIVLLVVMAQTGLVGAVILLWASLVGWVWSLYGLLGETLKLLRIEVSRPWKSIAALLVVLGTLAGVPYVEQLLYWPSAVVMYTLPLALLTLYLFWVLRYPLRRWAQAGTAVLAFLAAGCSDALAPLQLAIVVLLVLAFWRKPQRSALLYAFFGGLIGFVIVAVSPGNAVRVTQVGSTPSLGEALRILPHTLGIPLSSVLVNAPFFILAAWALPALSAVTGPRRYVPPGRLSMLIIAVPVVTFALVGLSLAPSLVMLNTLADPRFWVFAIYVLFVGTMVFGYVTGLALAQRRRRFASGRCALIGITVLLIAGCAVNGFWTASDLVRKQYAFAAAWDARDAYLRTQTGAQQTVEARSFHGALGLRDLTDNPRYWTNACIAAYYRLSTIVKDSAEPFIP